MSSTPRGEPAETEAPLLSAILQHSDDAILSKDLDGVILTWNRAAERMYGYSADEIVGRSVSILVPDDRLDEYNSITEKLKRGERSAHYDTVRLRKDGTRIEVMISISPIAGPDGALIGAASIAREIGERKRLEAERHEALECLSHLQATAAALAEAIAPDEVAGIVADHATRNLGAPSGMIVGIEEGTVRRLASAGRDPGSVWGKALSSDDSVAVIARTAGEQWIRSRSELLRRLPALAEALPPDIQALIFIPIYTPSGIIGALLLAFREPREHTNEQREFLVTLTRQCAQAMDRASLLQAEQQSRRDAEEARQRAAFLAEASNLLAASLDYQTTLDSVAHLVVPHLATWCVVHLPESSGEDTIVVVHPDPEQADIAREIHRRYPRGPEDPHGVGRVLRTGRTTVLNGVTPEMLQRAALSEEHRATLARLDIRHVLIAPLNVRGRTMGALTLIRGEGQLPYTSTDRGQTEDLAHRCALAVENARLFQQVQEMNRAKDEFQAMLAHELRNPIGAVSNALALLDQQGARSTKTTKYTGIASRQMKHVIRLLDDLLDVSRITRGRITLRTAPVDLNAITRDALDSAAPTVRDRGHSVILRAGQEPIWVLGDADRLHQTTSNLLDNAAKYTPTGGKIVVSVIREEGEGVIRIRDNGAGISPDLLPRVFDLFSQADQSLGRGQGGMGIGLTLVKRLVEMHGGTVAAYSEGPGAGSEFQIRLPLLPTAPEPVADAAPSRRPRGGAGRQVLIVEDNPDAAETLADLLETWGHSVRTAHDGEAALREFNERPSDFVLLDIGLPGLDGYEVSDRLRRLRGGAEATIVALSGYSQPEDRARSREAGFDAHLSKPLDTEDLMRLLQIAPPPSP